MTNKTYEINENGLREYLSEYLNEMELSVKKQMVDIYAWSNDEADRNPKDEVMQYLIGLAYTNSATWSGGAASAKNITESMYRMIALDLMNDLKYSFEYSMSKISKQIEQATN